MAIGMYIGRFGMIVPALAIAGTMSVKKVIPESLGTFRTDGKMFVLLLLAVVIIVVLLNFFRHYAWDPLLSIY